MPSRMVGVSASVNLPCTIKSISSLLAPAHPGGPGKRAVKRLCVCVSHASTDGKSHPAFTPQPQSTTALWPVLISRPTEGRRLSWPAWLVMF